MGVLLGAHGAGLARGLVPQAGLLHDGQALIQQQGLALLFELDGAVDGAEAVQIFQLHLHAQLLLIFGPKRNVHVAAQGAPLHPHVGHAGVKQTQPQGLAEIPGLLGGGHIGLGDDLHQGHRRPVVVGHGEGAAGQVVAAVHQLARVLLHVDAVDAHLLGVASGVLDGQIAVAADGQGELGHLIALGQVGIEIVFAVEFAVAGDVAVQGQSRPDGQLHHAAVKHRQHPRQAQTHRAHVGVGLSSGVGGAGAEDLGPGLQFGVEFQADSRQILGHGLPHISSPGWSRSGLSRRLPTENRVRSPKLRPMS